jgi:hypothetical protein
MKHRDAGVRTPMTRRVPLLASAGVLTAVSAMVATTAADAATQHLGASSSYAGTPAVSVQRGSARHAGSAAVFGAANGDFQFVRGLTGTRPHKTSLIGVSVRNAVASAINPVRGKDALLCTRNHTIRQVNGVRSTPHRKGPGIDASAYTDEGGVGYRMACRSVAMHGRFALATAHSQGLVQLRRKNRVWRIDRRVHFPGVNDAGNPHRRGWIDFRDSTVLATQFGTVAIAPEPLPNGKFLALTADREEDNPNHDAIVVVSGVGTAKPRVRGAVTDPGLAIHDVSFGAGMDFGNAGITFVPGTARRAIVLTRTGFAVLGLDKPSHPRMQLRTRIGAAVGSPLDPSSLTISANGVHLAVAVGNRIYGYKDVPATAGKPRHFKLRTSFTLGSGADEAVTDLAYTPDNTLVVLHGNAASSTDWFLTLVRKVPAGHPSIGGSTRTTPPADVGSLSVWPTP